jgi:hypothetical protein
MTAGSPLVFPGGRVVAGWWRQLAPSHPRGLWLGHFLLHRVEALLEVTHAAGLDRFNRLLLRALALAPNQTVPDLDARLHLGPQVLGRALSQLQAEGLAEPGAGGGWASTDLARVALDQGQYPRTGPERRVFHFVDRPRDPRGAPPAPPLLPLRLPAGSASPAPEGWSFDPGWLDACLRQPEGWKLEHGFPVEARRVLGPEQVNGGPVPGPAPGTPEPDWQRVILDRPEHLYALVVLTGEEAGGERLLGFAVRQEGWVLQAAPPAFALGPDWRDLFPQLGDEAPLDAWRQAWRVWCQPRGLPPAEVEACTLERHDHRMRVVAPRRLVERLRAARSDAFKGEAWLLAGTGNLRSLALLDLVEAAT